MKKLIIGLLVGACVIGTSLTPALAKEKGKKATPEQRFAKLDKNNDGMLSLAEFKAGAKKKAKAKKAE